MSCKAKYKILRINEKVRERKKKRYQRYRIPICKVYESSHKSQGNKASIPINFKLI